MSVAESLATRTPHWQDSLGSEVRSTIASRSEPSPLPNLNSLPEMVDPIIFVVELESVWAYCKIMGFRFGKSQNRSSCKASLDHTDTDVITFLT